MNKVAYFIWEEQAIWFRLGYWIDPWFTLKVNIQIVGSFNRYKTKEELMLMPIFNEESSWNSKFWLHMECDFVSYNACAIVFGTLSIF